MKKNLGLPLLVIPGSASSRPHVWMTLTVQSDVLFSKVTFPGVCPSLEFRKGVWPFCWPCAQSPRTSAYNSIYLNFRTIIDIFYYFSNFNNVLKFMNVFNFILSPFVLVKLLLFFSRHNPRTVRVYIFWRTCLAHAFLVWDACNSTLGVVHERSE